jgi:hypothetical protein
MFEARERTQHQILKHDNIVFRVIRKHKEKKIIVYSFNSYILFNISGFYLYLSFNRERKI